MVLARPAVPATAPPATQPNLLFILTDDQDLLLGSLDVMPRVRALIAAQGATFSNHFVPLSLCCPSRTTLLTGLHAHNHRVYTNHSPDGGFARFHSLGLEEESIGPALQRAGYRTGLMGKYVNLYPEGQDKTYVPAGWDEWDAPLGAGGYKAFNYTMNQNGTLRVHGATPADYLTDVLRDRALQFIAADPSKPFFLYLASFAPHTPSTPAPRHADLFRNVHAPRTPSFNEADMRDKPAAMRARPRLTPADIATLDRQYRLRLQSLQAVDEMVGALIQALGDSGQLANTFIVFTSDNGFHMGQHRMKAGKYTPYEEDVHVPLLVRGPGVAAGTSLDALTESVDIPATLVDLAEARFTHPLDGRSLVGILRGAPPVQWRQQVLLEQFDFIDSETFAGEVGEPLDESNLTVEYPTHIGVRTKTFKYVEYSTGERELYDLKHDPYELQNLAARAQPAALTELSLAARRLAGCAAASCRQRERAQLRFPALLP
ncbi:MAG: sulfatase [Acidobacteriota bacterium]